MKKISDMSDIMQAGMVLLAALVMTVMAFVVTTP